MALRQLSISLDSASICRSDNAYLLRLQLKFDRWRQDVQKGASVVGQLGHSRVQMEALDATSAEHSPQGREAVRFGPGYGALALETGNLHGRGA
jgi:hypothetical protein